MTEYQRTHPNWRPLDFDFKGHHFALVELAPTQDLIQASIEWLEDETIRQRLGITDLEVNADTEHKRIVDILANTDEYSWTITCDSRIIGNVSLNGITEATAKVGKRAGKVAIILGAEARGKGYSTRIRQAMIDWAFGEGGFGAIIGRIRPDNMPSIKMAERGGAILGEVEETDEGPWRYYTMYPPKIRQEGINRFLDNDERLSVWPTKARDKALVCDWLITNFDKTRSYSEIEVNSRLKELHTFSDWSLLRRELFERGLLSRDPAGTDYRVVDEG